MEGVTIVSFTLRKVKRSERGNALFDGGIMYGEVSIQGSIKGKTGTVLEPEGRIRITSGGDVPCK